MSAGGWLVMIVSVGGVTVLFVWCIWKVLATKGETEHIHGFEMDPPDTRRKPRR
jgi:heme/copper-type cytochrome/quinol oxidase subunit 2